MTSEIVLWYAVLAAGFYMAWNMGANDVANAMGTSVGSGSLSLPQALFIAATLEFCGAFFFGSHVSTTIQKGLIDISSFQNTPELFVYGMLASLLASGSWLQLASYYGWPVSTTHSIVGAILGFGLILGGFHAIEWNNILWILMSWALSPLLGGVLSFLLFSVLRKIVFYRKSPLKAAQKLIPVMSFLLILVLGQILISHNIGYFKTEADFLGVVIIALIIASLSFYLVRRIVIKLPHILKDRKEQAAMATLNKHLTFSVDPPPSDQKLEEIHAELTAVERLFSFLQIISASLMAFAHGANDVANAVGPLSAAVNVLISGKVSIDMPVVSWTLTLGGVGIVLGLATWGWRVIETIGKKLTELTPSRGFVVEFSAALITLTASRLGLPISTTHTLVGAVLGVGVARGIGALDLSIARDIAISWIVTVPAGAILSIGFFTLIRYFAT